MVSMNVLYQGDKHCELTHGPSNSKIETDAPKDNHGKGERFSPTDLMGAALGSCILTTMAILTENEGINLKGSHCTVGKVMVSNPRRIGELQIELFLPAGLTDEQRKKLEQIAENCPVQKSLHPEIRTPLKFNYSVYQPKM